MTPIADSGWPEVLTVGDRNHKVIVVRGLLQALGYGSLGSNDLYNAAVAAALKKMQSDAKISKDGKWGPASHRAALAFLKDAMSRADVPS